MKAYKNIILYLFLSFTIPLACILLQKVFQTQVSILVLYGIEAASPTIAVILLWLVNGKWKELRNGLHKHYVSNFSIKFCILAFLLQFILLTAAKFIVVQIYPEQIFISSLSVKKLIIVSWALVAEELGWRGLLQEELESILPDYVVPLSIGVIWACWHYHFFLGGTMEVPIVVFTLGCIFESYGYFALTKLAKGNIIPACICHFTGNLFFNLYQFDPSRHNENTQPYWIATLMYSLEILLFVMVVKKQKKR